MYLAARFVQPARSVAPTAVVASRRQLATSRIASKEAPEAELQKPGKSASATQHPDPNTAPDHKASTDAAETDKAKPPPEANSTNYGGGEGVESIQTNDPKSEELMNGAETGSKVGP